MTWSIVDVARISGVTSRTLRHYDAIGLLRPAWVGHGGRRYYETEELLRLQQILVLRELGLGLDAVRAVLTGSAAHDAAHDTAHDTADVLRAHRERLLVERDRLDRLAATVAHTISDLEDGGEMAAEKIFEGFKHNPYEAEARERWGEKAVDEANRRIAGMTAQQAEAVGTGYTRVHQGLARLRRDGVPVDDERVQALIAEHYGVVALFWTPDAASYTALGRGYVDDERFRRTIGRGDDAVVEYLRDAMALYAERHLA